MKQYQWVFVGVLGLTLAISGCSKKPAEQASLSGTGLDSLATTEELAQLPQSGSATQQGAIEVLPIETAPVTQGVTALPTTPAVTAAGIASTDNLNQQQKIQAALKAAGFYNGNIDGKIGPASKKAIKDFQQQNGLTADGKVGPKTWALLEAYLNGTASAATSAGAVSNTLD